ncbi:hypothetical protein D3C73_817230 [compost metagenome]
MLPYTDVRTQSEGGMASGAPAQVVFIGALEDLLVAVGGGQHDGHVVARTDHDAAHLDLLVRGSRDHRHGAVPAEALFDRHVHKAAVLLDRLKLFRVVEKGAQHGREAVETRVAARIHQLPKEADHDLVGKALAFNLGRGDH